MDNGKQPTWQTSTSTGILLGVAFAWVILGMLFVSRLNVGAEPANRSGFDFAFNLFYVVFLVLSALGTHVASRAWVLDIRARRLSPGLSRITREFAAFMASSLSFAALAGCTLTALGVFPWVLNIPMFWCVAVLVLLLHLKPNGGRAES